MKLHKLYGFCDEMKLHRLYGFCDASNVAYVWLKKRMIVSIPDLLCLRPVYLCLRSRQYQGWCYYQQFLWPDWWLMLSKIEHLLEVKGTTTMFYRFTGFHKLMPFCKSHHFSIITVQNISTVYIIGNTIIKILYRVNTAGGL